MRRVNRWIKMLRCFFSRSAWSAGILKRPQRAGPGRQPGLVLLQIDGLACSQFQRAMDKGCLPFLAHLVRRRRVELQPWYSGVPSTTPAFQAELYYGVRTAVPAFAFVRRENRTRFIMYDPDSARQIDKRLSSDRNGLLAGGTSYANIYAGGAEEARYCAQTLDIPSLLRTVHPLRLLTVLVLHGGKFLNVFAFALIEACLALYDFVFGVIGRHNILKELKFIPMRVGACIVLRELVRFHVKMDVDRGVKIIHANFLGYDEHAHRRGPSSAFAHWTLKGIDRTIRDIYRSARKSRRRDYRVVIFSDHGQEETLSYERRFARPVSEAIRTVFGSGPLASTGFPETFQIGTHASLYERSRQQLLQCRRPKNAKFDILENIQVAALGPLGHVYLPVVLSDRQKKRYASRLVREANIPLVFFLLDNLVYVCDIEGCREISSAAGQLLGKDHPYPIAVARDLEALCRHQDAGDFIISGWRSDSRPLTFSRECGSHGGPGRQETRGFLLLPEDINDCCGPVCRAAELRQAMLRFMAQKSESTIAAQGMDEGSLDNKHVAVS